MEDPFFQAAEDKFYNRNVSNRVAKVVRIQRHQTGKTNIIVDKTIRALKAGKRISKTGHIYYEGRKNRSDINPKEKL